MTDIHRVAVRNKLPPRNEPYWRHFEGTGYIGFRKPAIGLPKWKAKWTDDDGNRRYATLGRVASTDNYAEAAEKARAWFKQCEQGVPKTGTVKEACEAYVAHIEKQKDEDATYVPSKQFKQTVYSHPIAKMRMDKLRKTDIEKWKDELATEKRAKNSANRILRTFKAAMTFAFDEDMVTSDAAWKKVKQFPVQDGRRDIRLEPEQIEVILDEVDDDLRDLLVGYLHTGSRPGELPKATVGDLDTKNGILKLSTNKTRDGSSKIRKVPLTKESLSFFKLQARFRQDHEPLMRRTNGSPWSKHQWHRGLTKVREKERGENEVQIPDELCAYNIRHTVLTGWVKGGMNILDVARISGTSVGMLERHYYQESVSDMAVQMAAVKIF